MPFFDFSETTTLDACPGEISTCKKGRRELGELRALLAAATGTAASHLREVVGQIEMRDAERILTSAARDLKSMETSRARHGGWLRH